MNAQCPYCRQDWASSPEEVLHNLRLPFPPSANVFWRFVPGRPKPLISTEGRHYHRQVANIVGDLTPITGRFYVVLKAFAPDASRRRDLDNLLEGPLDALTYAKLWPDDSHVDRLLVLREAVDCVEPRIEMEIGKVKVTTVF